MTYDTFNHWCLLHQILVLTKDVRSTELVESMFDDWLVIVELSSKKSRWRWLKNDLSQGRVLAPMLFKNYTDDQPRSDGTCRLIFADDLVLLFKKIDDCRRTAFYWPQRIKPFLTRYPIDVYSFVSQSWCAFWQKNDTPFKWFIVKSTPEPTPQRKVYHPKDTVLLCDF